MSNKFQIAKDLIKAFMAGNSKLIGNMKMRYGVIKRLQEKYPTTDAPSPFSQLWSAPLLAESSATSYSETHLISKAIDNSQITHQELLALRTVVADFRQYFPFLIGFSLPIVGYAVPIVAAMKPDLLPPVFWREVTRLNLSKLAIEQSQQHLHHWRAFAKGFPAPLFLRELTLKAADGELAPSDYQKLDGSLPSHFVELESAHQQALARSLGIPSSLEVAPARLLEDTALFLRFSDALIRREQTSQVPLGPHSSAHLTASQLTDVLLRRNFGIIVPADEKASLDPSYLPFIRTHAQANDLLTNWLQLPISKLTTYPHVSILHRINHLAKKS